jgi:hypothetical protein
MQPAGSLLGDISTDALKLRSGCSPGIQMSELMPIFGAAGSRELGLAVLT